MTESSLENSASPVKAAHDLGHTFTIPLIFPANSLLREGLLPLLAVGETEAEPALPAWLALFT